MENMVIYEFNEMSEEETQNVDGGLVFAAGLALTTGAKIAIGLFAGGTALGVGWALCD